VWLLGEYHFLPLRQKILSAELNLSGAGSHFVSLQNEKLISWRIRAERSKLLRNMYKESIPEEN